MATRPPRRRLPTAERRDELLDATIAIADAGSWDDVSIEAVAQAAGASRALVYHYFPSRADLLRAAVERESNALQAALADGPLADRLTTYVAYVAAHPRSYRAVHRGALAADPRVREVLDAARERLEGSVRSRLATAHHPALAARAWTSLLVGLCVAWVDIGLETPADDVCAIALRALDGLAGD